jgi:hypothetical protein
MTKKFYKVFADSKFPLVRITCLFDPDRAPLYALTDSLRFRRDYEGTPSNLVIKATRGADDNGEDCSIEHGVAVNHNADLIFRTQDEEIINAWIAESKGFIDIYDYQGFDKKSRKKNQYELSYSYHYFSYEEFAKMDEKRFLSFKF